MKKTGSRRGTSLIDLLISMAIIAVLFGGIYLVYFSIVTSISGISVRTAAAQAIAAELETVRNLPYDSIGTVGGLPPGVIPETQSVVMGSYTFSLFTTVRNIDDPFDGTMNGNPSPVDTAPADYKLVEVQATCPPCSSPVTVSITTTIAPKTLESATQNGSLFLYAVDANGNPVTGATMQVVNASVTPSINITDTTNASGVLQLVGVPTSTQGYQISVGKVGYSGDRTYQPGLQANPNPVHPNATVVVQTVTNVTFAIDYTSKLNVYTYDDRCRVLGNELFTVQGSKLIGTNPNILKFATTTLTDANGATTLSNLEWDTYAMFLSDVTKNLEGTIPLSPLVINPSSTATFRFIAAPAVNPSLLVTVVDILSGADVSGATIMALGNSFSKTLIAGHSFVTDTDWSGGKYFVQSGGLDVDSTPGSITLLKNASGTYNIDTNDWLVSKTIDLGGSNSTYFSLSWNPNSQPGATTVNFQIAANNNNNVWNYVGPDGTGNSYFTSGGALPAFLNGNRYLRYKVFLNTTDSTVTPQLDDVTVEFAADCVPPAQALFTGLPLGTYTITALAPNYSQASATVTVGSGEQSLTIQLNHA